MSVLSRPYFHNEAKAFEYDDDQAKRKDKLHKVVKQKPVSEKPE
jgi:hypothetical protein